MNKFIVLAAIATLVAGEAPAHVGLTSFSTGGYSGGGGSSGGSGLNEYVDEALLARVGDLISRGGDGSGTRQGSEGLNLDSAILTRVSGSLSDGSSSGPSTAYGPPSRSAPAMLGQPEPAERIAEFDLSDNTRQESSGGYDAPAQPPSRSYGAPVRSAPAPSAAYGAPTRGGSSGAITLGRPEAAQRVADFAVAGQQQTRNNGGYQNNNGGYN